MRELTELVRNCKKCGKDYPLDQFTRTGREGYIRNQCRSCCAANGLKWQRANRDKLAINNRKYKYNLAPEKYIELLREQHGACAVCRRPDRPLVVDHDHGCCSGNKACGKCVRGLLCHDCNLSLGKMRDNVTVLQNAIDYLTKHTR